MGTVKKTFIGIICCICAICLMSHNTFAIEYDNKKSGNFEIQNSSYVRYWSGVQTLCSYTSQTDLQGGTRGVNCPVPSGQTLSDIQLFFDRVIPNNTLVNFYFFVNDHSNFARQFPIQATNGSDLILIDVSGPLTNSYRISNDSVYEHGFFYKVTALTKKDTTQGRFIFTGVQDVQSNVYIFPSGYIGLKDTSASVDSIKDQIQQDSDKHDQEINDQQNAVDDSKNSSNESQSDVNNSTSSLIDVLTQIIGAFTSASASSCVITMSYDGRFNQPVDLCALDPPLAITSLLSIVVVFILFKFASSIVNKIVSLIRSFQ